MKYYKRLKIYKCSNLTFDPETGEGSSYKWYSIARKFGKIQVLNTYGYSRSTIKHVWKVCGVLKDLNVPYVTIDAPYGLQDLDAAMEYNAVEREKALILAKTARKPKKYESSALHYLSSIKFLKKLGIKHDENKAKALAVAEIEEDRRRRKERALYTAQLVSA